MFDKVNSYVHGRFVEPVKGLFVDKIDPRNRHKLNDVASSRPQDVKLAIASAFSTLKTTCG